jgi:predicted transcriptional regulator
MLPYMADSRTTVYLNPDDYRRIKALARAQNRPAAELVREAVAEYARRHSVPAAPRSIALGRSGDGRLSEKAEEILDGFGQE